jgi:RHS repeat-associated protein
MRGETRPGSSVTVTDFGFTGQQKAYELGMLWYNSRFYDPRIMQFNQPDTLIPDPYQPSDWNRYQYARANPVRYNDPSGHCIFGIDTAVCAVISSLLFLIGTGAIITNQAKGIATDIWTVPPITEPRVQQPTSADMTTWLINQMQTTSNSQVVSIMKNAGWVESLKAWTAFVRTGAIWDFKPDIQEGLGQKNPTISLGGYETNFQAAANLFYGFIGSEIGFPGLVLEGGAGVAQQSDWKNSSSPGAVGPCNLTYFCDQPYDNWWISFGIYLQKQYGGKLDDLNANTFLDALNEYMEQNGEPPSLP